MRRMRIITPAKTWMRSLFPSTTLAWNLEPSPTAPRRQCGQRSLAESMAASPPTSATRPRSASPPTTVYGQRLPVCDDETAAHHFLCVAR